MATELLQSSIGKKFRWYHGGNVGIGKYFLQCSHTFSLVYNPVIYKIMVTKNHHCQQHHKMSSTNLPKNLDYRNRIRSNRNQTDKENLEFLRAESRTGLEKLLTLSNSRIPRPTATATIRNQRPEECMALQIWKPKYVFEIFHSGP